MVNKLLAVKFFIPVNLLYYVGQHLTYCSGKKEITEINRNDKEHLEKVSFSFIQSCFKMFFLRKSLLHFTM